MSTLKLLFKTITINSTQVIWLFTVKNESVSISVSVYRFVKYRITHRNIVFCDVTIIPNNIINTLLKTPFKS